MCESGHELTMSFDGSITDRKTFLKQIRYAVIEMTQERMTLDAIIVEMAKNIFDHAGGVGFIKIIRQNNRFFFEVRDGGEESHDFAYCSFHSRLVGNGVNHGTGLQMICDLARDLGVELTIDTSGGFSYIGVYSPVKNRV
jgi:hypothetical protein